MLYNAIIIVCFLVCSCKAFLEEKGSFLGTILVTTTSLQSGSYSYQAASFISSSPLLLLPFEIEDFVHVFHHFFHPFHSPSHSQIKEEVAPKYSNQDFL